MGIWEDIVERVLWKHKILRLLVFMCFLHRRKKDWCFTMIHSIIKRDGRIVLYEQNKIAAAILKAMEVSGEGNAADAARVANDVQLELESQFTQESPHIEVIQDAVERQLMNHGFNGAAKAYILYRANRKYRRQYCHGLHVADRCCRRKGV